MRDHWRRPGLQWKTQLFSSIAVNQITISQMELDCTFHNQRCARWKLHSTGILTSSWGLRNTFLVHQVFKSKLVRITSQVPHPITYQWLVRPTYLNPQVTGQIIQRLSTKMSKKAHTTVSYSIRLLVYLSSSVLSALIGRGSPWC